MPALRRSRRPEARSPAAKATRASSRLRSLVRPGVMALAAGIRLFSLLGRPALVVLSVSNVARAEAALSETG